ncbi:uncharacterized protein LOC134697993 [Mytilus trossulus]|uniref:uncharacterized protein LOC134697993 n=1 Tax=Mytilus trossulus TaxID=6551 RepID=UPI00300649E3
MNNENDKGLLTILTMNCRSLRSEAKRNMLQTIIETHEPHIVHLQETHLDKTISTAEILDPEQYEIVRKDRITEKGHEGGGIINAVRKNIVCNGEDTLDTNCEIGWTKIQLKGCKALYTGCYYRKPDNEPTPLQNLNTSISRLTHYNTLPNIILTRDFNLPEDSNGGYAIKSSHNYSIEINKLALDIVEEHCLQQRVTEPTREKKILDLVLTTNENLVQKMSITDGMSDHQMIIRTANARPKVIKNKHRKVYQYKKGNMEKVQEYLNSKYENFKEKLTEMNIEEYWTLFKTHLFQAMDLHIPSKNLTSRFNLPWVNQHIKKMIRKEERLYKVAKKYQTKEHWDKFKQYRKAVKTELDISHKKYIFDMLEVSPSTSEASTNTQDQYRIGKKYWKYIKSKKRETVGVSTLKVNGGILDNSKGKAEALNAQFQSVFTIEDFQSFPKITENETSKIPSLHISTEGLIKLLKGVNPSKANGPDNISCRILKECAESISPYLQLIFTKTLKDQSVQQDWLIANVIALFKKGDKSQPVNYRPVSLTSVPCKIMEHIIFKHIMNHLRSILYLWTSSMASEAKDRVSHN